MTYRFISALLILITLSAVSLSDDLSQLTIMTEDYPPFNYQKNGQLVGFSVELLEQAMAYGARQHNLDIKILPWPRAYQILLHNPQSMLFSMTRTRERESQFKWVGPISMTRVVLLAKKDNNIKIHSTSELTQFQIGAIRNDIGDQSLRNISDNLRLTYPYSVSALLKMLDNNRIQLLAYEQNVLNWYLDQDNYDSNEFEPVFVLEDSELYYAFNKEVSDTLVERFQQAIDRVKTELNDQGHSFYYSLAQKYSVSPSN